jgi:hypothetical protein
MGRWPSYGLTFDTGAPLPEDDGDSVLGFSVALTLQVHVSVAVPPRGGLSTSGIPSWGR